MITATLDRIHALLAALAEALAPEFLHHAPAPVPVRVPARNAGDRR